VEPAARRSPSARRGTRWTAPRRGSLPEPLSRAPARRALGRGGTARRTRSPRRAPRGPGTPGARDLALASSVRFRRALARAAPRLRLSDGIDRRRRAPARAPRCSAQRRRVCARRAGRRRFGSPSDRRALPRGLALSRCRPDRRATRAPCPPRTPASTQRCSAAPCAGFLYAGRVKASSPRSDRTEQQAGRQGPAARAGVRLVRRAQAPARPGSRGRTPSAPSNETRTDGPRRAPRPRALRAGPGRAEHSLRRRGGTDAPDTNDAAPRPAQRTRPTRPTRRTPAT
jgi:hypothetical protein